MVYKQASENIEIFKVQLRWNKSSRLLQRIAFLVEFYNVAIIFKLNVLFKILKNMFMTVFRKHLLAGVIITVEIKLKRISFLSDSARFISQMYQHETDV